MRFAYTNLLWLFFTMIGLGCSASCPRPRFIRCHAEMDPGAGQRSCAADFWREYKAEFLRSNLIGAVLAVIGLIIYIDLAFIYPSHFLLHVLRFAIMIFGFLFISMLFMYFLCLSILIGKTFVCEVFALAQCGVFAIYARHACADCRSLFPACVPARHCPFFSVSLISYCHMRMVYAVLLKVERQDGGPQRKHQTREAFYPETR